jgi:hypothetical protein
MKEEILRLETLLPLTSFQRSKLAEFKVSVYKHVNSAKTLEEKVMLEGAYLKHLCMRMIRWEVAEILVTMSNGV